MIAPRLLALLSLALAAVGCDACAPDAPAGTPERPPASAPRPASEARSLVVAEGLRCLVGEPGWVRCHGDRRDHVPDSLTDVAHLALRGSRRCVVHRDGSVSCWEGDGSPRRIDGVTDARAVALGEEHACALRAGGEVLCWGRNRRGQLGDGTTEDRQRPAPVADLDGVAQIVAGAAHTCALGDDGAVRCWGGHARLDDVAREPRTAEEILELMPPPVTEPLPAPVAGPPGRIRVERLAAGADTTCAVTGDRRLVCWPGYLGHEARSIVMAWPTDAVGVAVGVWGKCALREGGAVVCWDFAAADGSGRAAAPVAVRGLSDALEVAVGEDGACARRREGRVSCWTGPDRVTVLGSDGDTR